MLDIASRAKHRSGQLSAGQQAVVMEHMNLAETLAWRFCQRSSFTDRDEIEAEAMAALVVAVQRWPGYCQERNFDASRQDYLKAFLIRCINGRIMDWARKRDHLSRGQRAAVKAIRAAEDEQQARTEHEIAAATGLTPREIRTARAADAVRSVPVDVLVYRDGGLDQVVTAEPADPACDVESAAVTSSILTAATGVFGALPVEVQAIVGLAYYHALDDDAIGPILALPAKVVAEVRRQAVCDVHGAMMATASGARPRILTPAEAAARYGPMLAAIPPGWEPPRRVSDADQGRGTDAGSTRVVPGKMCVRCGEWFELSRFAWWSKAKDRRSPYHDECDRQRQREAYARRQARREMAAA